MNRFTIIFLLLFQLSYPQDLLRDAIRSYNEKRYTMASKKLEQLVCADPLNEVAGEYLGDCYARLGDWDNAVDRYEKLVAIRPSSAEAHYKLGAALGMSATKKNKLAALLLVDDIDNAFHTAIKLDPKHIGAHYGLIELYIQLPSLLGGSESKARKHAATLGKHSPVDGWLARGHIAEHYQKFQEAETCYRNAINIGHSPVCYQKLADLYKLKMNQPEKAKLLLQSAPGKT